ncbi:hypothetical protein M9Y10_014370 [Tritrichomonas musculus]|uniref:Uncharacterized protein n=1 Tax=Tritrichomonas musculus TaxID=1915356 RepID=A0ABR2KZB9_9EUKA
MDSTLLFLKEEANRIRKLQVDNFYLNTTDPINISIKSFLDLFNIIIVSKDKDLILGFCFSLAPFISNNHIMIKSKYSHDIWTNYITFSEVITEPIQIFGFCEGVLATSFYCLSIDQSFLDFLLDSKPHPCKNLKASLLASLYSDLPFDFVPFNSKILLPTITEYFKEAIPIQCILNVYLADLLNFTSEELKSYPDFEYNLWSSIYRSISDDFSCFSSLSHPFIKFRRMNENFFSKSCDFISQKIEEIEKNSYDDVNMKRLIPLALLLPFFSSEDVEKFMRKVIPIVSLYIARARKIPKELTSALNESKDLMVVYSVAMKLYSICTVFLETEFYPAVVYFLSIYLSEFSAHYWQCCLPAIHKFADGLDSSYPIKFPLAFAFYENSNLIHESSHKEKETTNERNHHHTKESGDECNHHQHEEGGSEKCCQCHEGSDDNEHGEVCGCCHHSHECCGCGDAECSENSEFDTRQMHLQISLVVKERVIPALFKVSVSQNSSDVHWAFKAIRSLLDSSYVESFPSLSSLFEHYSLKPEANITSESLLCHHHFYKFLCHYIEAVKSNESQLSEAVNFTNSQLAFISSSNEKSFYLVKADFCNLIQIICNIDSSNVNKFYDYAMSLSNELLSSDYSKSFVSAFQLASLIYTHKDKIEGKKNESKYQPFIEKVLKICKSEVHSNSMVKKEIHSNYTENNLNSFVKSEVVKQLHFFDFVKFSDISEIVKNFFEKAENELNLAGLQIIDEYLKKYITDKDKNPREALDLIVIPFIDAISTLLKSSKSEKVVNKSFSILTTILDSFSQEKEKINVQNILENVIRATLLGRLRLFDHLMCYNYSFLQPDFKFFSFSSHFIVKYPKSAVSKNLVDDFSLWILRISNNVIPKLLKVLEIALAMKIIDSQEITVLSAAVISRINEDNWKLKLVEPSVLFLLKLKQKFQANFPLNSLLVCLEKVWEENQDDNPKIIHFLLPVFLQIFAEKSFNISGDFLVFHDISTIIAAESFDFNYPEIVNSYIQMYQNKIPFESFDKCSSIVFTHFLTKDNSTLIDIGFSIDSLKIMHTYLKQMFKNNKSTERFIENYFAKNQVVMDRIKYIKKSPKLPEF